MDANRFLKFPNVRRVAAVLLSLGLTLPSAVLACPLCKDAIADDPVASAFNWTTLLMIAMPLVLVASIGGWVSYVYWRAARHSARARMAWHPEWTEKESQT